VYGYRDAEGKSRTKTYKSFGYLDELERHIKDPVEYFTEIVAELNDRKEVQQEIRNNLIMHGRYNRERSVARKNLGYAIPYVFYSRLKIEAFWKNIQQQEKLVFDLNSVFRLLTLLRTLEPISNSNQLYHKNLLFERSDFSDNELYQALSIFAKYAKRFYRYLGRHLEEIYEPNRHVGFLYTFSIYLGLQPNEDVNLRKLEQKGRSQEISQIACLVDGNGIPMATSYLPPASNTWAQIEHELERVRQKYDLDKLVVVGDIEASGAGDITAGNDLEHLGCIVSMDAHNLESKELRSWVLDDKWDDVWFGDKYKSRQVRVNINQLGKDGKVHKAKIPMKLVCRYSKHLALEQRKHFQHETTRINRAQAARDNATGQGSTSLEFNNEMIRERELFDGYAVYACSEPKLSFKSIAGHFQEMERIRSMITTIKPFVVKPPVGFPRQDYIDTHLMICYVATMLSTLLRLNIKEKGSAEQISRELLSFNCLNIKENLWFIMQWTDEIKLLLDSVGLQFSHEPMTLADIRHQIATNK
jgi:hypothetical protein